ncbi:hypothetical protein DRN69_07965 [Candidatus Pacearchaeota archaeon]|nr:MAG: hypothetical protein DRN69_07965 [Candidatus Pacearchaeota archaeon]
MNEVDVNEELDRLVRRLNMYEVWGNLKELIRDLKIVELVLENNNISKEDKKKIVQVVLEKFPDKYIEFLKKLSEFLGE